MIIILNNIYIGIYRIDIIIIIIIIIICESICWNIIN
jgi:hypothetical protein